MYKTLQKSFQAHDDGVWGVAWAKGTSNGTIVTGSVDSTVKTWAWENETTTSREKLVGHRLGVVGVDVNAEGTVAVSSSIDSQIIAWDLTSGESLDVIDCGPLNSWTVALSPDGKYVATGSNAGDVHLYSLENYQLTSSLSTRGQFVMSVAFSPNGRLLACGAFDGAVFIFDVQTAKLSHKIEAHAMPVRSVCFSDDSETIFTASDDGTIKMYSSSHPEATLATLVGHSSWVLSVAASPDGARLASSSSDKTIKIWDIATRSCLHTFDDAHTNSVRCGRDGVGVVGHLAVRRLSIILPPGKVWSVSYNHNGSLLASVSDDGTLCIHECP